LKSAEKVNSHDSSTNQLINQWKEFISWLIVYNIYFMSLKICKTKWRRMGWCWYINHCKPSSPRK
jgi:hypothetical protein